MKLLKFVVFCLALCAMLYFCFQFLDQPGETPGGTDTPGQTEAPGDTETPDNTVTYKVTFLIDDEIFSTVDVKDGEAVNAPRAPTKEATDHSTFVFDGWYNGDAKWDFDTEITADVSLSAKFNEVINTYKVEILDITGSVVSTVDVIHGGKLTQPETPDAPDAEGTIFTFDGWYNGSAKWDFENDIVKSSMSLKPVFASELIDVTVTFMLDDETVLETVTVKYGTVPTCSVKPEKAGTDTVVYVFSGWDKELAPATEAAVYTAQFREYAIGKGNTDDFSADNYFVIEEEKEIMGAYHYYSSSKSEYPIIVNNGALVFNVLSPLNESNQLSHIGVLSIDLGSVKAGKSYIVTMDLSMELNGVALTDGFAYAFAETKGANTNSLALAGYGYTLLSNNGSCTFLFTADKDIDNLYFCIRSQNTKGYVESTATIDNVLLKEVNLSGANISNGTVTEDFSNGLVLSQDKTSNWYGNVKVYSPNLNATVSVVDGKLVMSSEQSGQKGLLGFYIDGIVAGKSYEISMDLALYDAEGADLFNSNDFRFMLYYNNAFANNRYKLYVGDNDLGITPTPSQLSTDGKTVTFKFTATEDGYVIITLRADASPRYAEIDNFSMKEVETYAKVTFKDADGNVISETKYLAGTEIAIPDAITKESTDTTDFTFDGWYKGETKLVAGTTALYDATYVAKFSESARKYTITYYNEDDTVYQTVEVAYGEAVELIAVPEKDGNTGVWVGDVHATMPAQNISYKVSYSVVSYTATITLNGEAFATETFTADNKADVLSLILSKLANDAQYTYTHDIPAELPLENCEYNVVRTVNQYTVTYVVDGVETTETLAYGATPAPAAPSKDGHTFTGWTPVIATVTGNATYTATFKADFLDVTEDFENGSINWRDYTGANLSGKRPNENSSFEIVDYNGSKALAITRLSTITSGGYAGMKIDVKPNTTYVVTLDLAAVGATTADLSGSGAILFEVYENANIGTSAARLAMFSNTGRALTTNQKISSFKTTDGKYQVVFTTSDFEGESGYVYFSIRLDKSLTEDTTVYLDNFRVQECKTIVNENYDNVTEVVNTVAKGANSTVAVENGALKATCVSGKQGFLGVYVKVEAGKTYIVNFDATVKGADGTDYSAGTAGGGSATVMVFQNNAGFNNTYRVNFMASKANASVNNTPLPNVMNVAVPNYSLTFTATEDGYVYIAIRTNNIAQESYITLDNLLVSELPQ